MATYTAAQTKGSGSLGEELTGAKTFTITNYTGSTGTYPVGYLTLEGNPTANQNLAPLTPRVGGLKPGITIPLSNSPISCDINQTATIQALGGLQGSGSILSFTATGWNGVNGSGTGKITEAIVVETGSNYISGDTITIPRGTPGIQGLGFTNADKPAIMDVFPDKLDGTYIGTNMTGSFGTFANGIASGSLLETNRRFSISIFGSGGTFIFTPSATIAINSYYIKGVGPFDLAIS